MARRRSSRRKNPADVSAGSIGVFLLIVLFTISADNLGLGPAIAAALAATLLYFYLAAQQRRRVALLRLRDLRSLSPKQLENLVDGVLSAQVGWRAEVARYPGDQGADVIAVGPQGVRLAIQVKHYPGNVGNKAVQEVVASKAYYRAGGAAVFTSGPGFTRSATLLAQANGGRCRPQLSSSLCRTPPRIGNSPLATCCPPHRSLLLEALGYSRRRRGPPAFPSSAEPTPAHLCQ